MGINMDSFRTEVFGIIAILLLLRYCEQYFQAQGTVWLASDSQAAVRAIFCPQSTCPSTANHWDAVRQARNLHSKLSHIKLVPLHVKSHQAVGQETESWAYMNNVADQGAKFCRSECPPHVGPDIKAIVQDRNGFSIFSNVPKSLTQALWEDHTKDYWTTKMGWETHQDISWESFGSA